jgi:putative transposase
MITILSTLVSLLSFRVRSRASLELELIALRHQVIVLRRGRPRRLRLFLTDRLFWVWLYRLRPQLRKGFRMYWRWRSRRSGRHKTNAEIRDLIRRMSSANPFWGAPRIHGELLKLGIDVSQATVGRYLPRRPKTPSPTWRSFLHNHLTDTVAIDMFSDRDVSDPVSIRKRWRDLAREAGQVTLPLSSYGIHEFCLALAMA